MSCFVGRGGLEICLLLHYRHRRQYRDCRHDYHLLLLVLLPVARLSPGYREARCSLASND
ncbi:hypothetical protein KSI87_17895 [Dickeya zeae]|nr:hypothetical protein [Dickeya zeae]